MKVENDPSCGILGTTGIPTRRHDESATDSGGRRMRHSFDSPDIKTQFWYVCQLAENIIRFRIRMNARSTAGSTGDWSFFASHQRGLSEHAADES